MGNERRLMVAITGASGSIYAIRFLEAVMECYDRISVMVTENGARVIRDELGLDFHIERMDSRSLLGSDCGKVEMFSANDMYAPPASGSVPCEGMVVVPCSMGTAGRIASGVSSDLVCRAADVCLKEHRRLILVVRETPFNLIHLRNLTALAEAGAIILPASPAFYSHPKTVEDMVSFVVARTMQVLGLKQTLLPEWEQGQS